jgi:hypothetical protein
MEILKSMNHNDSVIIEIQFDAGKVRISYEGNFDLYIAYKSKNVLEEEYRAFLIAKEDSIYPMFDKVYNDLQKRRYIGDKLFVDGNMEWHSDEAPYESASVLGLEKCEGGYVLSFKRGDVCGFPTFGVRISTSGSRYGYAYIDFMNFYRTLVDTKFNEKGKVINLKK